jgi:hypothetical protein
MSLARKHVVRAALLCALAVAVAPVAAHGAVARTGVTAPCCGRCADRRDGAR